MAVLLYLFIAVATWGAWSCLSLYQNYRKAQAFGFPIVIVPVGGLNPLWILIYNIFPSSRKLLRRLPLGLGDWVQYSYFGWTYHDGGAAHRSMGPAFVLCTPAYFEIVLADPTAALAVLTRRKEYTKPMIIYDTVNLFGPNVDGLEGEDWQRHRRLTAPSLNDRVNPPVWEESSRQCQEMIAEWVAHGEQGTRRLREDIAALALHVWLWAGFGISSPFREKDEKLRPPHTVSYMEALFTIMNSFEYLCIFPMNWLSLPFMPGSWKRLGRFCNEFKLYLGELVQSEKEAAANGESTKVNLLSTMVRASEEEWEASKTQNTGIGLKDNEIFGNLFIYSFAGFETTANALATSIAYLAACPTWQDWLAEEITSVVEKERHIMDLPFNETFPKLNRCLAILYETQRLNGSVVFLWRVSGAQTQALNIAGTTHAVPPNTYITVNMHSIHCDRKSWGSDADEWRPSRWITKSASGEEELIEPRPGTFMPWAVGPHNCPGRKFAQVEFVSVMTTLFRKHVVSPLPSPGGSMEEARAETLRMIKDSAILGPTNRMRDSSRVPMVWKEKAGGV